MKWYETKINIELTINYFYLNMAIIAVIAIIYYVNKSVKNNTKDEKTNW